MITPYAVVKVVRESHGACSVATIAQRLDEPLEDVAHSVVIALGRNMLAEHPSMPNIYGLPEWYR